MSTSRVPSQPVTPDPGMDRWLPLRRSGRVIRGDLTELLGLSWGHIGAWLVLAVAAGVDVVTFKPVLDIALRQEELLSWVAAVGFTAVALALAHHVGIQYRDATSPGSFPGAMAAARLCFGIWLSLGVVAFVVRWVAPSSGAGKSVIQTDIGQAPADPLATSQFLAALLFLVLYVATGTVSGLAGRARPAPAARRFRRARRVRRRSSRRYADLQAALAEAQELQKAIAEERGRQREVAQLREAAVTSLQQYARLLLRRRR